VHGRDEDAHPQVARQPAPRAPHLLVAAHDERGAIERGRPSRRREGDDGCITPTCAPAAAHGASGPTSSRPAQCTTQVRAGRDSEAATRTATFADDRVRNGEQDQVTVDRARLAGNEGGMRARAPELGRDRLPHLAAADDS